MQLYREGDRLPLGRAYLNLSSGHFRVVDVPRGQYTLRTVQYQADPPLWLAAETPIMVTLKPIQNLQVELSRGLDIPVSFLRGGSASRQFGQPGTAFPAHGSRYPQIDSGQAARKAATSRFRSRRPGCA